MDLFGLLLPGPAVQFPPDLAYLAKKSERDEGIQKDFVPNLFYRLGTFDFHCNSAAGN
jgi:hypothetical protein